MRASARPRTASEASGSDATARPSVSSERGWRKRATTPAVEPAMRTSTTGSRWDTLPVSTPGTRHSLAAAAQLTRATSLCAVRVPLASHSGHPARQRAASTSRRHGQAEAHCGAGQQRGRQGRARPADGRHGLSVRAHPTGAAAAGAVSGARAVRHQRLHGVVQRQPSRRRLPPLRRAAGRLHAVPLPARRAMRRVRGAGQRVPVEGLRPQSGRHSAAAKRTAQPHHAQREAEQTRQRVSRAGGEGRGHDREKRMESLWTVHTSACGVWCMCRWLCCLLLSLAWRVRCLSWNLQHVLSSD